ncbi:MAG: DUF2079 domain-containing protein [Candidatus Omnitrophica bacterium]|nr:DUF2079 domain-containing protein [Candidatus Omnitrophota bacterium]
MDRQASLWVFLLAAAFAFYHIYNVADRFQAFEWNGLHVGVYSQLLWNMSHGRFISAVLGATLMQLHLPLVMVLAIPVYAWIADPYILAVLQTLALAAGCLGVYSIGRIYLAETGALLLSVVYCVFPPLLEVNAANFHPLALSVPFVALSVTAFLRRRSVLFLLALVAVTACDARLGCALRLLCSDGGRFGGCPQ